MFTEPRYQQHFIIFSQVICLGVLIASAVALASIDDLYSDDIDEDSTAADDRDRYRAVAGWLLFVGIAGIITQGVMVIVRGLYYAEIVKSLFMTFVAIVSLCNVAQ